MNHMNNEAAYKGTMDFLKEDYQNLIYQFKDCCESS
jgi:hypothetical protein